MQKRKTQEKIEKESEPTYLGLGPNSPVPQPKPTGALVVFSHGGKQLGGELTAVHATDARLGLPEPCRFATETPRPLRTVPDGDQPRQIPWSGTLG